MNYTNHNIDQRTTLAPEFYREAFGPGYQVSGVGIRAMENDVLFWTSKTTH